ncbi:MAG: metal ABC transporter permease [Dehalococcoidia bacterium]
MDWLTEPLDAAFMQRALLASLLVALVGGVIGTFVVLKGLAFIGDALAHSAFAGVAAAFVLGGSIYLGSIVAGVLTALAIAFVSRRARISFDTAIGILFVGAFAFGIMLISASRSYTVDLFSFVFGDVLGVGWEDIWVMAALSLFVLLVVAVFYREALFTAYDPTMAAASGVPVAAVQYGQLALLALTTVVALKVVGIVLVVAMLVTPAATAQLVVRRVPAMMAVAVLCGAVSAVAGLYISYYANVASGAAIVLVATGLFLLALLLSPRRGLLAAWRRQVRVRRATTAVPSQSDPRIAS